MIVYDNNGNKLELVDTALKGGEGRVCDVTGHPNLVAKLYLTDAESHREKIEAMVTTWPLVSSRPALRNVAWPMAALYADPARSTFVGFGMRRVDGECTLSELHEYPAPDGLSVSLREKVDFLIKLSDMVGAIHGIGQVIGDFNDGNVLMTRGSHEPALVDVDSFCTRCHGVLYRCELFADDIVAPEIIRSIKGPAGYASCPDSVFSFEADDYALAVHVFRVLMNGVHPFACVPSAGVSVPARVGRITRVARGETPFFKDVPGMEASLIAPSLKCMPPYLVSLFRRAFVDGNTDPSARPTPSDWKRELTRYRGDLTTRNASSRHDYWKGGTHCPYCEAELRHSARCTSGALLSSSFFEPFPSVPAAPAQAPTPAPARRPAQVATPALAPTTAVAAAAPAPEPGKGLGAGYWTTAVGIALSVFVLLGVMLPVCSGVGGLLGLGYPLWLQALFAAGAVAGACLYSHLYVTAPMADEPRSYALAGAASAGGIAVVGVGVALVMIAFVILVVLLILSVIAGD